MDVEDVDVRGTELLQRLLDGDVHVLRVVAAEVDLDPDRVVRALVLSRELRGMN